MPPARKPPQPPLAVELDHLVIACSSLGTGAAWLEELLGTSLAGGGSHPGWGTHNRLLKLDRGAYLELIAPDPGQASPSRPRLFGLDQPELQELVARRPRLVHYVMRCADLAATRAALDYDPGANEAMSRGSLTWRLTVRPDGGRQYAGVLPSLIDWGGAPHPAGNLPDSGLELERLEVLAPAAVLARAAAALAGDDRIACVPSPLAGLRALLCGRGSTVVLD